jgi:hypothetical protein
MRNKTIINKPKPKEEIQDQMGFGEEEAESIEITGEAEVEIEEDGPFVVLGDLPRNLLEDILENCFFYSPESSTRLSLSSQGFFETSNDKKFMRRIKRNPFFGSDPTCLSIFKEYTHIFRSTPSEPRAGSLGMGRSTLFISELHEIDLLERWFEGNDSAPTTDQDLKDTTETSSFYELQKRHLTCKKAPQAFLFHCLRRHTRNRESCGYERLQNIYPIIFGLLDHINESELFEEESLFYNEGSIFARRPVDTAALKYDRGKSIDLPTNPGIFNKCVPPMVWLALTPFIFHSKRHLVNSRFGTLKSTVFLYLLLFTSFGYEPGHRKPSLSRLSDRLESLDFNLYRSVGSKKGLTPDEWERIEPDLVGLLSLKRILFKDGYQPHRDRTFIQRLYRSDHGAWFALLLFPDSLHSLDAFSGLLKGNTAKNELTKRLGFAHSEITEALSMPSITSYYYHRLYADSQVTKTHRTLLNGEIIVNHIEKRRAECTPESSPD